MTMTYFGVESENSLKEIEDTRECRARFVLFESMYAHHLVAVEHTYGNNEQVMYHKSYELRSYLFYLVDTSILVDKCACYVDVVYLNYFTDLERIHEYNWEAACLVYMYSKLTEGYL